MFAMVWLLPVPGGPSITKLLPATTAAMALRWLESASRIVTVFSGGAARSTSASLMGSNSNETPASEPIASPLTASLARTSSSFVTRSRRMGSLWKEKVESTVRA